MKELESVIVSQAIEICELRERLADAISTKALWMGLYNDLKEKKPTGAANTDEPMDG